MNNPFLIVAIVVLAILATLVLIACLARQNGED